MKKVLLIFISILLNACISTSSSVNNGGTTINNSSTMAKKSNPDILVGKQNREALKQEPFAAWFNKNYSDYTVDPKIVNELFPYLEGVSIKAFMGTWCGDSKREIPTFYKILDTAKYNYQNFELFTVNKDKNTPEGYEKGVDIIRVPTFIFYKEGKEIGRYVEFARETLEKDMLAIVSGAPYQHSYED